MLIVSGIQFMRWGSRPTGKTSWEGVIRLRLEVRIWNKRDPKLDTNVRSKEIGVGSPSQSQDSGGSRQASHSGKGRQRAIRLCGLTSWHDWPGKTCLGVSLAPAPVILLTPGLPVCLLARVSGEVVRT